MIVRRTFAATAALIMAVALSTEARAGSVIRIAHEGAYEPFDFVTPEGKPAGFDIDIADALCEQMQAECVRVQQDWDSLIPALLARKIGAIIASMSIIEERKERVAFTRKYYQASGRFVARKGADIRLS